MVSVGSLETVIIAIVAFIPMLLVLVVVHELGHFATARAFGIKVLEFGVGYPPRAFGFYTGKTQVLVEPRTKFINLKGVSDLRPGQLVKVSSIQDTDGSLVATMLEAQPRKSPLWQRGRGGIKGGRERAENNLHQAIPGPRLANEGLLLHEGKVRAVEGDSFILADMVYSVNLTPLGGFVRLAGESNPAVPRSLASKGAGTRFVVLVAGPLMNAILPIALFAILFMFPRDVTFGDVVVEEVVPNSPAAAAGVRPGDIIVQADGHRIENQSDLHRVVSLNLGSDIEWRINRAGVEEVAQVRPRFNPPEGEGATGVRIGLVNQRVESRSDPPWVAIPRGFTNTWEILVLLKQEVFSWIAGGRTPEFSGPIGIAQVTGEVTEEGGFAGWLVLVILFSINLAILNILPIPMLDGGRLVFVVLEWLRRGKRIPPEKEGLVHLIGFVVLISAILLISVNDINRLLQGQSILGG